MHRHAGYVIVAYLHEPAMDPDSDLEPEVLHGLRECIGALQRAFWVVEEREDAIATNLTS